MLFLLPVVLEPAPAEPAAASPPPPSILLPEKEKEPEVTTDPAMCPIVPGRETTIEIQKGKSGLGLSIVGGADTLLVSTTGPSPHTRGGP